MKLIVQVIAKLETTIYDQEGNAESNVVDDLIFARKVEVADVGVPNYGSSRKTEKEFIDALSNYLTGSVVPTNVINHLKEVVGHSGQNLAERIRNAEARLAEEIRIVNSKIANRLIVPDEDAKKKPKKRRTKR